MSRALLIAVALMVVVGLSAYACPPPAAEYFSYDGPAVGPGPVDDPSQAGDDGGGGGTIPTGGGKGKGKGKGKGPKDKSVSIKDVVVP